MAKMVILHAFDVKMLWVAYTHFSRFIGKLFYLWWPIWVGPLSLWFETWEAPRRPLYTDPEARHSSSQLSSQTSFYVCTSYWTPSGWLSSEAHFACQSNRGFGFPLRTWTGTHHFCWNLFCQDFNPDMAWCDSFGFHLFSFDSRGFYWSAVLDHFDYIHVLLASIWQLSMTFMFQVYLTWLCMEGSSISCLTFPKNEYQGGLTFVKTVKV